jgi:hypothetical protein
MVRAQVRRAAPAPRGTARPTVAIAVPSCFEAGRLAPAKEAGTYLAGFFIILAWPAESSLLVR